MPYTPEKNESWNEKFINIKSMPRKSAEGEGSILPFLRQPKFYLLRQPLAAGVYTPMEKANYSNIRKSCTNTGLRTIYTLPRQQAPKRLQG